MRDLIIMGICLGILLGAVYYFSEQETRQDEQAFATAQQFILTSSNYERGGFNLTFVEERSCNNCNLFVFTYQDWYDGFDNDAQRQDIPTARNIIIVIQRNNVASAIMDDTWNMLTNDMLTQEEEETQRTRFCIWPGCLQI